MREHDVLLNITGASIGRVCLAPGDMSGARVHQHVCIIRIVEDLSPAYVERFFAAPDMQRRILEENYGFTRQALTKGMIEKFAMPLRPAAEQRRIVAKLNALTARLIRARAELSRISDFAQKLRETTLTAAFAGDLTNSWRALQGAPKWETTSLVRIASEGPTNGWSPKSGPDATGALALKLTATTRGKLRLDEAAVKRIYELPPKTSKFWLREGDLLIQRANSLEYVGASAIYSGPDTTYIYPDLMMRIRITDPILTRFVWYYLNAPCTRRYFQANATGTAGNMPKINGSTVRELRLPLPSEVERREILNRLDSTFAYASRLEAEAARARALLDRLEAAILAKAFKGELVPQDPNEEPATVLLDRIRAQGAAAPTAKHKPRAARRIMA